MKKINIRVAVIDFSTFHEERTRLVELLGPLPIDSLSTALGHPCVDIFALERALAKKGYDPDGTESMAEFLRREYGESVEALAKRVIGAVRGHRYVKHVCCEGYLVVPGVGTMKQQGCWRLYHLPSGIAFPHKFKTRKLAVQAVQAADEWLSGFEWDLPEEEFTAQPGFEELYPVFSEYGHK